MLQIITNQLNGSQIKALHDTFMALDGNGDGLLTAREMEEGLRWAGLKDIPPELQQTLEDIDFDGSGAIDYTQLLMTWEYLTEKLDRRDNAKEGDYWAAFSNIEELHKLHPKHHWHTSVLVIVDGIVVEPEYEEEDENQF